MAKIATLTVCFRFWLIPYINTLLWLCDLMGTEPDWDKLGKIIDKGIYIK